MPLTIQWYWANHRWTDPLRQAGNQVKPLFLSEYTYKILHKYIYTCNYIFKDKKATTVTKSFYLFAVNDVYQLGELRQLPDGKVYFIDGDDKYVINHETTKIQGKVVSILEKI